MNARCPYCSRVFETSRPGLQPCPGCGGQLNVPAPAPGGAPEGGARCAQHADRPASGTCVRCGAFTCDECSLSRTAAACPVCRPKVGSGEVLRAPTPWERRGELGILKGLWLTWKATMLTPAKFWPSVQPEAGAGHAFFYGWTLSALAAFPSAAMTVLNLGSSRAEMDRLFENMKDVPAGFRELITSTLANAWLLALGVVVSAVVLYPLSFVVNAAVVHLGCLLTGAAKNGFSATMRALGYAEAPSALAWVPVVGSFLGIYTFVLLVWGLAKLHETTVARALFGALLVPLVLCCLFVGAIAAIAGGIASKL